MSSWVWVLEQLAELDPTDFDPDDLSDEQLRVFLPRAQIGINRLTAAQTAAVAAGDARQVQRADGMVSMKSWLTGHCRSPVGRRPIWCGTRGGWRSCRSSPPRMPPARSPRRTWGR